MNHCLRSEEFSELRIIATKSLLEMPNFAKDCLTRVGTAVI